MRYIGSKKKLNDWLFSIILKNKSPKDLIFLDACAGSGAVSEYASSLGFKKIISNDMLSFPQHVVTGATSLTTPEYVDAKLKLEMLNKLPGTDGFFYQNYSEDGGRLYFTNENAKRIDVIRQEIEKENNSNIKSYLIYCLLEAASAALNTTGIQCSYLKYVQDKAKKSLILIPMNCVCLPGLVEASCSDILSLLTNKEYRDKYQEDILYCDPPYNSRQYATNYHLFETIAKYDNPVIVGKTGQRDWSSSKSKFCSKSKCLSFLKSIIKETTAKNIYFSYSSDGILSLEDFKTLGDDVTVDSKDQKRYKADASTVRTYDQSDLKEYVITIRK